MLTVDSLLTVDFWFFGDLGGCIFGCHKDIAQQREMTDPFDCQLPVNIHSLLGPGCLDKGSLTDTAQAVCVSVSFLGIDT